MTYPHSQKHTRIVRPAKHPEGSPEPSKTKKIAANQHKTKISENCGEWRVAISKPALLAAALWYAARRKPVFPLHSLDEHGVCTCGGQEVNLKCKPGKHPRTPHGHLDASTDPRQITEWWIRWPSANIGIPTGKRSGWLVMDEDQPASLDNLEAEHHGRLPATRTHSTGSGRRHHIFCYPPGTEIRNSAGKLAPGLDVRGEGGYIVAP